MSEREDTEYDVIVVGAGLSGLTAAYRMLQYDGSLKIIILEAKDRIGGRTLSTALKGGNSNDLWDLGGQWVGRPQIHIMELMKELGIEVHEQYSNGIKFARLSDGKIRKYTTSIPITSPFSLLDVYFLLNKADKLCKEVTLNEPISKKSRTLDSLTLENFKQSQCWTEGVKELFDSATGVIFGAHPSQISLLFYLHYCQCAGGVFPILESGKGSGQEWRVKGGAQSISLKLLEYIGKESVWLQEPVDEINQASNDVIKVTTKTGKILSSKYVVMATPPHQAMCVNFTPPLPFNKEHLLRHMPVGHLIKFVVTYETPFWREDGFSGEVVSYDNFDFPNEAKSEVDKNGHRKNYLANEAPVSVVYDATTADGNAALVGFISGLAATRWTHKTETEQRRGVIGFLKSFFGEKAEDYFDFAIKDWSKESWNGGCPVNYAAPGALSIYGHCLKEPFERVHWAGTETATLWTGFMNGAVQAGTRAANEILHRLYPDFVTSSQDHCNDASHQHIATRDSKEKPWNSIGIIISAVVLIAGVVITLAMYWF